MAGAEREPGTVSRPDRGEGPPRSPEEVQERLADLQLKLIEQEHRTVVLLKLFFWDSRDWAEDDRRHAALKTALVMRLFFSPTTAAAAGGLIGILSVGVLVWQTRLVERQIAAQKEQHTTTERRQREQDYYVRHAALIKTLYDTRPCAVGEIPARNETLCPASSSRARAAAALALVEMERAVRENPGDWSDVMPTEETDLSKADLRGANLAGVHFSNVSLAGADLQGATLRNAVFRGANLIGANLAKAKAQRADFADAELRGANLTGTQLQLAEFPGSKLVDAEGLDAQRLQNCKLCPSPSRAPTEWPAGFVPPETCTEHSSCR